MVRSPWDVARELHVAAEISSYRMNVSKGWSKQMMSLGDRLSRDHQRATRDFLIDFRGAVAIARTPAGLQDSLASFYVGLANQGETASGLEKAARAIAFKLSARLQERPGLGLTADQMQVVREECAAIPFEMETITARLNSEVLSLISSGFSDDPTFQLIAWGSQRAAYLFAFAAYESFVRRICQAQRRDASYRIAMGRMQEAISDTFDKETMNTCWQSRGILLGMLIRHSLVHNAGRESDDLRNMNPPHGLLMDRSDKMLHIMPCDTAALVKSVELAARALLNRALGGR